MDVGYVPQLSEERDALVEFTEHFLADMKPHELPSVLLFFHHIGYAPSSRLVEDICQQMYPGVAKLRTKDYVGALVALGSFKHPMGERLGHMLLKRGEALTMELDRTQLVQVTHLVTSRTASE
jgi:hypothetical protein